MSEYVFLSPRDRRRWTLRGYLLPILVTGTPRSVYAVLLQGLHRARFRIACPDGVIYQPARPAKPYLRRVANQRGQAPAHCTLCRRLGHATRSARALTSRA